MNYLTKEELELLLNGYKDIGNKIVKKLMDDYYDDLSGLFKERNIYVEKLKLSQFKKEDLISIYNTSKIQETDDQIRDLINIKKTIVLNNFNKINCSNKVAINYKKNNSSAKDFGILALDSSF